jgi:hypothetical protein
VQEIADDVDSANLGVNAYICYSADGGGFLSEFVAYHGVWYQNIHEDPGDPAWCVAAGHVHVGGAMSWAQAEASLRITLRTLIRHVDKILDPHCHATARFCETTAHSAGAGAWLTTTGSTSISSAGLRLIATEAPTGTAGIFFYGASKQRSSWGNGLLCVAGTLFRAWPTAATNSQGLAYLDIDYHRPPFSSGPGSIAPGSTWNFQYVFRDDAGDGARFDSTNGMEVLFCP